MKDLTLSGLELGVGSIAIGSLPSYNADVSAIKGNVSQGMSKFSEVYPTAGKLAGIGLSLDITRDIVKKSKGVK